MLDFPRWKVWTVILTIAFCFAAAVPSFFPQSTTDAWPSWVPKPRINLGLDLAGGSQILLEGDTADIARQRIATMEQQVEAEMRRRDQPRISIGDISTAGGRLSFMVRDAAQVDAARERINQLTTGAGMSGQRDWDIQVVDSTRFILTPTSAGLANATEVAMAGATEVVRTRIDSLGTREPTIIRQGDNRILVQVPGLDNPQALIDLLGKTARLEFRLVAGNGEITTPVPPAGVQYFPYAEGGGQIAVQRRVAITGEELTDATQGFDPQDNRPIVNISFDSQGGRKFATLSTQNVDRRFAIIVDNVVISAPSFNEPILGGQARISGNFTIESANTLAIALSSGRLPVELAVIEQRTVSAELGADSIEFGIIACIVGSALVMLYMFATYGWFGMVANLALIINVLMILGIMAVLNTTLTLPGLAGFVLTIGAAVDANVIINERIREELRRGRRVLDAIDTGWREASTAILDANVTNLIAGALMFAFGTGPIRGFAVVMVIGIATSAFTAITFARLIVTFWARRTRPKELYL